MASGVIVLRPGGDISVGHQVFPSGSPAYLMISEEVSDGNSTYIYDEHDAVAINPDGACVSTFAMGGSIPTESVEVTSVILKDVRSLNKMDLSGDLRYTLNIGGTEISVTEDPISGSSYSSSFYEYSNDLSSAVNIINEHIQRGSFPYITLTIETNLRGLSTGYKTSMEEARFTQIYLEISYTTIDTDIYRKIGSEWIKPISAYKKEGGTWVETTFDECRTTLENSLIRKTVTLKNLVSDGSFEDVPSNWTVWLAEPTDISQFKDGRQSLKLGGNALASSYKQLNPVVGHKYYAREYIKTNGQLTADDCRFEMLGQADGAEHTFVFGRNMGNFPDWTAISSIVTIDRAPADGYSVRTFTVNGTVDAWVDSIVLVDLTESFGAGNEPEVEWCDENIPYFEGYLAMDTRPRLVNMLPAVNGNIGFNTGVSDSTHTKYSGNALLLRGDTSSVEVGAMSLDAYPIKPNHLYYARAEIYQETTVGSADFYFPVAEPVFCSGVTAKAGQWTMLSEVKSRDSFPAGNYQFRLDFNNIYSVGEMWFDGMMLIDLTAAFGSGNEPNKEWCDEHIPYFVGEWYCRER